MSSPADLNRGISLAHDALARRLPRYEDTIAAALRSLAATVAAELTASLAAAAWEGPEPEALTATLRARLEAAWLGRHTGAIERLRAEAMRATVDTIAVSMGLAFDLSNPVLDGALRTIANRTDLPDQSWEMVGDSLQASYDEGLGIPEAARDLRTRVNGMAPARARTIARTELISVSNVGSLIMARESGAAEWKTWLATNDARTRNAHALAAGQTRRIDDTFTVGGEEMDYPGDPAASAANVVNCRCTWVAADGPDGYDGPVGPSALLAAGGCACGA